jgi:hypothetical protein
MPISTLHASHITDVNIGFVLAGPELDPASVSQALGIAPDTSARRGEARLNPGGQPRAPWDHGWWRINSAPRVSSKDVHVCRDINAHFEALLAELLPHRGAILQLARGGSTYFDVLWKSTYLYAGTGPLIDPTCVRGMAALEAGVGFDIYSVEAPENEA